MKVDDLKVWIDRNLFSNNKIIAGKFNNRWFNNNNKEILHYIKEYTSFLDKEASVSQRIWHILNDKFYIPKCKECGSELKYTKFSKGYGEYCSRKCTNIMRNRKAHNNNLNWNNIIEKAKKTKLERYSDENFNNRNLAIKTNLEKYGVKFPQRFKEVRYKTEQTCLKKYGVKFPLLNREIKKKSINTLKQKYNVNDDISNPFEIKPIKDKIKSTNLRKYGVEYNSQINLKNIEDLNKDFIENNFIDNNGEFKLKDFQLYYNISYSHSYKKLKEFDIDFKRSTSRGEEEIFDFIKSISNTEIIRNSKKIIPPYEIDIYLPEYNLAIEYNGLYWHSELSGGKDKNYHLKKTELCEKNNIQLIHIFENKWEDEITKDILKSMISGKMNKNKKIYARNCYIKEVNNKEKNDFLNKNHIQGQCQSSINIGLFYNNKMVSLMTFSRSRFNKNYKWELLRFCNIKYYNIIGGASKILNNFINKHGNNIITYADRTYSNGNLYDKIGFELISTNSPSYYYFINGNVINRMKAQKRNLPNLLKDYNPNITEWKNMQLNGFDRIWDCGNYVFEYK